MFDEPRDYNREPTEAWEYPPEEAPFEINSWWREEVEKARASSTPPIYSADASSIRCTGWTHDLIRRTAIERCWNPECVNGRIPIGYSDTECPYCHGTGKRPLTRWQFTVTGRIGVDELIDYILGPVGILWGEIKKFRSDTRGTTWSTYVVFYVESYMEPYDSLVGVGRRTDRWIVTDIKEGWERK